jgi:hypothetical protein
MKDIEFYTLNWCGWNKNIKNSINRSPVINEALLLIITDELYIQCGFNEIPAGNSLAFFP